MNRTRTTIITAGIFAATAMVLALPSILPSAIADEEPMRTLMSSPAKIFARPMDTDGFVKWDFTVDPAISTEPIRQSSIKKIAFGRVEMVEVIETATGIYSSDAMTDPHVQYPGIARTRKPGGPILVWNGRDWVATTSSGAGSFVTIVPFDGGQLVVTDDGACSYTSKTIIC